MSTALVLFFAKCASDNFQILRGVTNKCMVLVTNSVFRGLVRRCMQIEPGARPTMQEIIDELKEFDLIS